MPCVSHSCEWSQLVWQPELAVVLNLAWHCMLCPATKIYSCHPGVAFTDGKDWLEAHNSILRFLADF